MSDARLRWERQEEGREAPPDERALQSMVLGSRVRGTFALAHCLLLSLSLPLCFFIFSSFLHLDKRSAPERGGVFEPSRKGERAATPGNGKQEKAVHVLPEWKCEKSYLSPSRAEKKNSSPPYTPLPLRLSPHFFRSWLTIPGVLPTPLASYSAVMRSPSPSPSPAHAKQPPPTCFTFADSTPASSALNAACRDLRSCPSGSSPWA